jgi:hypothetical protein
VPGARWWRPVLNASRETVAFLHNQPPRSSHPAPTALLPAAARLLEAIGTTARVGPSDVGRVSRELVPVAGCPPAAIRRGVKVK